MSQRTWNQHINYMGNVNRILEMHQGGCKEHQISGVFQDEGIDIKPHQVKATIESHEAMCSKSLPTEVAKNAINHNAQKKPFDLGGDLQPA
ncbi:hypothetical protein L1A45_01165 [Acinetobacter variabilis]|uniref:hypothetical protein n=1 Tax=Acinetobacter TaxID=469 RepID=UPI0003065139|nr:MULTISPECIES: hypothetical protein [Acinetobacter]